MEGNIISLLKGKILIKEINLNDNNYRSWIEISLQDEYKPIYPFRVEPYAMLGHSPYTNMSDEFKFKIRTSCFLTDDINNEFDPNYDMVGKYIKINSLDELIKFLDEKNLNLKDFVDVSYVDDYPL